MTEPVLSTLIADLGVKKNDTIYFVIWRDSGREQPSMPLYSTDLATVRRCAEKAALDGFVEVRYGCILGSVVLETNVKHLSHAG